MDSFNAPIHVFLNHTLYLHDFSLLFFRLCIHQVMVWLLKVCTYICTYRLHVQVERCWSDTSVRNPFSIRVMSNCYSFNSCRYLFPLKRLTAQWKENGKGFLRIQYSLIYCTKRVWSACMYRYSNNNEYIREA